MANKILTVKQYLNGKALDSANNIDQRLTQAFAQFLKEHGEGPIKYVKNVPGCHVVKLETKLVISDYIFVKSEEFPLVEIFLEIVAWYHQNKQRQIILNSLWVTPEIIDVNSTVRYRGIMAVIKYLE